MFGQPQSQQQAGTGLNSFGGLGAPVTAPAPFSAHTQQMQHHQVSVSPSPYQQQIQQPQVDLNRHIIANANRPKWTQQKVGRGGGSGLAREYYERRDPSAMIDGSAPRRVPSSSRNFSKSAAENKVQSSSNKISNQKHFGGGSFGDRERDFGSSFGTLKPSMTRRTHREMDEEAPPNLSIYDTGSLSEYSALKKQSEDRTYLNPVASLRTAGDTVGSIGSGSSTHGATIGGDSGSASASAMPVGSFSSDDNCAVVVFGFSIDSIPEIIKHFARFGSIRENVQLDGSNPLPKRVLQENHPGESVGGAVPNVENQASHAVQGPLPLYMGANWIKLTYESPYSASRALNENGTLFQGQFLIGVTLCTAQRSKALEEVSAENAILGIGPGPASRPTESGDFTQKRGLNRANGGGLDYHSDAKYLVDQPPKTRRISIDGAWSAVPGGATDNSNIIKGKSSNGQPDDGTRLRLASGHGIFTSRQKVKRSNENSTQGLMHNLVASPAHNSKENNSSNRESWLGWGKKIAETLLFGGDEY